MFLEKTIPIPKTIPSLVTVHILESIFACWQCWHTRQCMSKVLLHMVCHASWTFHVIFANFPFFFFDGKQLWVQTDTKNDTKRYPLHRSVSPQTPPAHSHATTSFSATTTTTTTTTTMTTTTTTTTTTTSTTGSTGVNWVRRYSAGPGQLGQL